MKNNVKAMLIAAGGLTPTSLAASQADALSINFQNVTFTLTDNGSPAAGERDLILTITNSNHAGPDWTGITALEAFSLKPDDNTYTQASATLSSTTLTTVLGGVNNGNTTNGCAPNANNGFFCFTAGSSPIAVADTLTFDVLFTGGDAKFINIAHMQVCWWVSNPQNNCTGSLMSKDI